MLETTLREVGCTPLGRQASIAGALATLQLAIERTVRQLLEQRRAARRTLPSVEELEARRG